MATANGMPWRSRIHQPVDASAYGRAKAKTVVSRSKRGYTRAWYEASRLFLTLNPLCVHCMGMDPPIRTPSKVTDHVIPHKGDMRLFWDRTNWQPLCIHHHNVKTGNENA